MIVTPVRNGLVIGIRSNRVGESTVTSTLSNHGRQLKTVVTNVRSSPFRQTPNGVMSVPSK